MPKNKNENLPIKVNKESLFSKLFSAFCELEKVHDEIDNERRRFGDIIDAINEQQNTLLEVIKCYPQAFDCAEYCKSFHLPDWTDDLE